MKGLKSSVRLLTIVVLSLFANVLVAENVIWYDGQNAVTYAVQKKVDPVVKVALDMFASDMEAVTDKRAVQASEKSAAIRVVQLDRASASIVRSLAKMGVPVEELKARTDAFHIEVIGGQITVVGANGRGAAYGVLELSRMAGVSPWV